MASALTRAIYRALLQTTRSLDGPLRLRLPLHNAPVQWMGRGPQHSFVPSRSAARELFPATRGYPPLPPEVDAPELEPAAVSRLIGKIFRGEVGGAEDSSAAAASASGDALDVGLHALKVLHSQMAMAKRSSACRTECPSGTGAAVLVEATSAYRGRDRGMYVFQYRVRVSNVGAVPVQIMARSWDIRNADGSVHASVPRGSPGIVGQTPRLLPGDPDASCFEYASGTTLATPGGSVEGSLQVVSLGPTGDVAAHFDAQVASFRCEVAEDDG